MNKVNGNNNVRKFRFKKHTDNSFFGNFLYQQILPKNHFLVVAKEIIDWRRFTDICLRWYQPSGELGGNSYYEPSKLLRMLFLVFLYNISERQIEERVNLDLSFKYFVGLGANELSPDHSTLTYFKKRLIEGGGKSAYDQLLKAILSEANKLGIVFGKIQIIDSVHSQADVNTDKDKGRQKDKDKNGNHKTPKPPRDPDARWGVKHQKKFKDPKTKKIIKQKEFFYGYKAHTSLNAKTNLVTSITTNSGNNPDGKQFSVLVNKDNFTPIPRKNRTYSADKAYDDGDNHEFLKQNKLGNAIRLQITRTQKKNPNKEIWQKLIQTNEHRQGLKERYKIERKFGEAKLSHGLRRCKYLGETKFHLQACLTAIVLNLKVVVASITGSTLKGYPHNNYSNCSNRAIWLPT